MYWEWAHPMGSLCQGVLQPHGSGEGRCGVGLLELWWDPAVLEHPWMLRGAPSWAGLSLLCSGYAKGLLEVAGLQQSCPCWPGNRGLLSQEVLSNSC